MNGQTNFYMHCPECDFKLDYITYQKHSLDMVCFVCCQCQLKEFVSSEVKNEKIQSINSK